MRRDRVTLIGTDPGVDGIQAAGNGDPRESALLIRDARRVRVENLQLTGATWSGLQIIDSTDDIAVVNARLESNDARGSDIIGSNVTFEDVVVTGNGDTAGLISGILVFQAGQLVCNGCTIEDNPAAGSGLAVLSSNGSSAFFEDSTLEGLLGLAAQIGSHVGVTDSSISATAIAVQPAFNSTARLTDTTFSGTLQAFDRSELRALGATELGPPNPNLSGASDNASLILWEGPSGATTLVSDVFVDGFSNARIENGTTIENLFCSVVVSDAYCDGTETKVSSNCASCP